MKKTVLITGAGGGIGRAAAEAFLDSGWEVIGVDKYEIRNPLNKIHYIKERRLLVFYMVPLNV